MTDATMILNEDGTAADASPAALDILGVTLDQLRELPGGAFSANPPDPQADAAFRERWERQGSPEIGGEANDPTPRWCQGPDQVRDLAPR